MLKKMQKNAVFFHFFGILVDKLCLACSFFVEFCVCEEDERKKEQAGYG
jgi:hypothetical protein